MDRKEEIRSLHEKFYEQSLLFQTLRAAPDSEAARVKTRELVAWIYNRIRTLA